MARIKDFTRLLDDLYVRRTHWLRGVLTKRGRSGAPPRFAKRHVVRARKHLQQIASDALARKLARREFERGVLGRKSWHITSRKGHGRDAKKRHFKTWFQEHIEYRNCIYAFWDGRRCLYVGKTETGAGRIASHFVKFWFGKATRVDVYATRGRRVLPALECTAIHRFLPSYNKSKAESKKWTRKCPLCKVHKGIETELKDIFQFR